MKQADFGSNLLTGTHLSRGMIARLRELAAETHPEQTVWIGDLAE